MVCLRPLAVGRFIQFVFNDCVFRRADGAWQMPTCLFYLNPPLRPLPSTFFPTSTQHNTIKSAISNYLPTCHLLLTLNPHPGCLLQSSATSSKSRPTVSCDRRVAYPPPSSQVADLFACSILNTGSTRLHNWRTADSGKRHTSSVSTTQLTLALCRLGHCRPKSASKLICAESTKVDTRPWSPAAAHIPHKELLRRQSGCHKACTDPMAWSRGNSFAGSIMPC